MTAPLTLSVVMPTFNRRQILPRAMASIFAQDLPAREYEVIVVVDGSTDGTAEYLRTLRPACALRIIEQSNRGLAVALNQGLAAARGRLVLFMDDDIVLHPSNFRAHLDAHATEDSLVVHGPVFVSEDSSDTLATEWIREGVAEEIKRWEVGWTWPDDASVDPNYSISRAALLACGGYDEAFTWRQNAELGLRLAKMGLRFRYEAKAVSYHVYVKTAEQLVHVQARWWGKDDISLFRKHPDLRPHSALARLATAPAWKRLAIQAAARLPISPDVLLLPGFALADKLHSWSTMRQLGLRLLWKRVAISFFRGAVETVGWRNLQGEFCKRLPVLMYHHVGPPQPNSDPDLSVSAERFEAQIRFLARRGYVGIRPSDWLSWLRHGKPLPAKPMLLTFDDAFEDLNDHVFPALERYGFGAVVFVVTNRVGKANIWDQRRGYALRPCLTVEQIQHWSTKGIDFGAHTRNHPDLTRLEEPELHDEVAGSRSDLEKTVGFPVISFAYPYGLYNAAAADCAGQHFDLAFTTDDGLNTLRTNRRLLHRNMVFGWDTPLDLEFLVQLGWNPIRRLRARLRIRSRFLKALRHMRLLPR